MQIRGQDPSTLRARLEDAALRDPIESERRMIAPAKTRFEARDAAAPLSRFEHALIEKRQGLDKLAAPAEPPTLRDQAEETARQFEAVFVQKIIEKMRESAEAFGEGGIFGKSVGNDTYAQWFDQNLAMHVTDRRNGGGGLGVVEKILEHLEDLEQVPAEPKPEMPWRKDDSELQVALEPLDGDPVYRQPVPAAPRTSTRTPDAPPAHGA